MGFEFPLAAKLYLGKQEAVSSAAGTLYACDLLGGWLAGILGGILLLPVIGLINTCFLLGILKLSSLIILSFSKRPSDINA